MARIRVGICMEDTEYVRRLSSFLMSHYSSRLELMVYSSLALLTAQKEKPPDVMLLSDGQEENSSRREWFRNQKIPVITLSEESAAVEEDGWYIVDKYQDVNHIVDVILKHVGSEVEQVMTEGRIASRVDLLAVYSLTEAEFQLPFAATMGAVFGEKRHVLLLDLQENSGLSSLYEENPENGLEELMVMASLGRYTHGRIRNCIGHLDHLDCVYPIRKSENLCEADGIYDRLIRMLLQNHNYSVIILNFGTRFPGFFDLMNRCRSVFLLEGGSRGKWREEEWKRELELLGYQSLQDRIIPVEIPPEAAEVTDCERLVQQWRWNEVGSTIRRCRKEVE